MSPLYQISDSPTSVNKKYFSRREIIPSQNSNVWQIQSGSVRTMTYLDDGTIVTLGIWGAGDIVGGALSAIEPHIIECLSAVEVIAMPLDRQNKMVEAFAAHVEQAEELMVIRSYRTVDSMLLKLLGWLSKRFGRTVENGQLIDLRLTNQDVAEILCSTRVTVSRVLTQFEEQGIIQRLPIHRIVLCNCEILHRAS
ncbi:MAG: Crp/Fnr family transcriptional regulator [Calothrix sp. C42_A2020_038]|nr:Crp/Fnr family transcriptional regulator [Calothrix sp. C42_A2020_038]